MPALSHFFKDETGATAIEYGLIAAATGLSLIVAMPTIKTGLSSIFNSLGTSLNN